MKKIQVIEVSVDDIHPYENNPRKNDDAVKYVANSIREFGFKVPIIIDKENVIVAGHTRYKAAKELGMETVPAIVADDLTEEQVKAFRLADNKTGEIAVWDFGLRDLELGDIEGIDMAELGFDDAFDYSYIDDLMENGLKDDPIEQKTFSISFSFDKQYEETVKDFINENGKEAVVEMILSGIGK